MIGLISRLQKNMNSIKRNDISSAIRELYNTEERNRNAFIQREKELRITGIDVYNDLYKIKNKLKLLKEMPTVQEENNIE